MIGPGRTLAGPRMAWKARLYRLNWFVGKIIPSLLVVYGVSSWKCVVFYLWRGIDRAHPFGLNLAFLAYSHIMLYVVASSYLRIYLARQRTASYPKEEKDCDPYTGLPTSPWAWARWFRRNFLPFRLRDTFPSLPDERAFETVRKGMIHQCEPDGSLPRCSRDECKGRWKPARTRHCGDCRTCRFALDHHCPLFDHDIVAKQTMGSFFAFLVSASMLLLPLLPLMGRYALQNARAIGTYAWTAEEMHPVWWSKRWTWLGGPTLRYAGALVQAQQLLNRSRPGTGYTIWPAAMLFFAVALSAVAIALLGTTLRESLKGDLAIDRERLKLWERKARMEARKAAQAVRDGDAKEAVHADADREECGQDRDQAACRSSPGSSSTGSQERPDDAAEGRAGPSPWLYFWVPASELDAYLSPRPGASVTAGQQGVLDKGGVVVRMHELDRPYRRPAGSWVNVVEMIAPVQTPLAHAQWPLAPSAREELCRRAARQFAQLP